VLREFRPADLELFGDVSIARIKAFLRARGSWFDRVGSSNRYRLRAAGLRALEAEIRALRQMERSRSTSPAQRLLAELESKLVIQFPALRSGQLKWDLFRDVDHRLQGLSQEDDWTEADVAALGAVRALEEMTRLEILTAGLSASDAALKLVEFASRIGPHVKNLAEENQYERATALTYRVLTSELASLALAKQRWTITGKFRALADRFLAPMAESDLPVQDSDTIDRAILNGLNRVS